MKIAHIAPLWKQLPPDGYGGIEAAAAPLIEEQVKAGAHVEVFTVGSSKVAATRLHYYYEDEQYDHITDWFNLASPLVAQHLIFALNQIREQGDFDVIHDNTGIVMHLPTWSINDLKLPPVLFTLHGPLESPPMEEALKYAERLYVNGIAQHQFGEKTPVWLRPRMVQHVYNGLCVNDFPFVARKANYFVTMARINHDKGQDVAVRLCHKANQRLVLAGHIEDEVMFGETIGPHLRPGHIDYVGEANGRRKLDMLKGAKALLFPIRWHEPFGMAVIEALACGTPVVAMNRGAMPEIIEHGVNGFLASSEREFSHYMTQVDQIDPYACRASVERKFSIQKIARDYLDRYEEIIARTASPVS